MTSKRFLTQFGATTARLTSLTQELFISREPASPEKINAALAELLRSYLSTIGLNADPEKGYAITRRKSGLTSAFMKGFLFRLPNNFDTALCISPDQKTEMSSLLAKELKRLALIPDLAIPNARLSINDRREVSVFPVVEKSEESQIDPSWTRAKVGRFKLSLPHPE